MKRTVKVTLRKDHITISADRKLWKWRGSLWGTLIFRKIKLQLQKDCWIEEVSLNKLSHFSSTFCTFSSLQKRRLRLLQRNNKNSARWLTRFPRWKDFLINVAIERVMMKNQQEQFCPISSTGFRGVSGKFRNQTSKSTAANLRFQRTLFWITLEMWSAIHSHFATIDFQLFLFCKNVCDLSIRNNNGSMNCLSE